MSSNLSIVTPTLDVELKIAHSAGLFRAGRHQEAWDMLASIAREYAYAAENPEEAAMVELVSQITETQLANGEKVDESDVYLKLLEWAGQSIPHPETEADE